MASLETLHSRQAKVEAPQKCQLTTAEGGQGCCRNTLLSWSAGAQPTDSSGECSRDANGAPKLCLRQHGLPNSDGDAPPGLVPSASCGEQPWYMVEAPGEECGCQVLGCREYWCLSWELRQSWPCLQELCCGQGTELPHERAMGEVKKPCTIGEDEQWEIIRVFTETLLRQKTKQCSGTKKGQLEVLLGEVVDGDSQDPWSWKLVTSDIRRKAAFPPLGMNWQNCYGAVIDEERNNLH